MMQTLIRATTIALFPWLTAGCSQPGVGTQPVLPGPSPLDSTTTADDVLVVDQSQLDDIAASYTLSEPLGEVSATTSCESASAADPCTNAARQQLRQAALARQANLVLIIDSALAQSYPMRLSLKGRLYRATPR